ncbi:MAG: CPBP family intramembrane metalloprotease [Aigarchaeota archaeon]|nr:CPBP family intramembrane metalloprotease [Candidatus Pelearchaeum maunauluense]
MPRDNRMLAALLAWALALLALNLSAYIPGENELLLFIRPQVALALVAIPLALGSKESRKTFRTFTKNTTKKIAPITIIAIGAAQLVGISTLLLYPPDTYYINILKQLAPSDAWDLMIKLALTWVVVAPVEEIFFRGVIHTWLRQVLPSRPSAAFSSIIFAVSHLDPWRFLPTVIIGYATAVVLERTKTIMSSIVVHGLNNSAALVLALFWLYP